MGRTRATLSKTALDRTVATEVDTALRAVHRAYRACYRSRGGDEPPPRLARTMRDLAKAKGALNSVGRTSPGWDTSDPDLIPEETRSQQWRLKLAEERLAKEQEDARLQAEAEAEAEAAAAEAEAKGDS